MTEQKASNFETSICQKSNFYQPVNQPAKVSPPFQGGDRMFLKLVIKIFRGGKTAVHEKCHQQQTLIKTSPKTTPQLQHLSRGRPLDTSSKEPTAKPQISSST